MKALVFTHGSGPEAGLSLRADVPEPLPAAGEALVDLRLAGICATDLEITRGYMGFSGVLGHEFVGTLRDACGSLPAGRRVVGEINAGCGDCEWCLRGEQNHCPTRTVVGILGRPGIFAEHAALPVRNLHPVPDGVPDEEAVFAEPLAAAFRILEQVPIGPLHRVILLGDGRLGLLAAQVLRLTGCELTVLGHHPEKLALLEARGVRTCAAGDRDLKRADVVVDATGSPEGFAQALALVRPRGTVVLKTTCAGHSPVALAPVVIDEVTVVGSRCGPFAPALRALAERAVDVRPLIDSVYDLDNGLEAFARARAPGVLKVLLRRG